VLTQRHQTILLLLRNARADNNPDLAEFAELSIAGGAAGLTAHPRPDQRHIRPSDILILAKIAKDKNVEFNIEGNPFAVAQGDYPGLIELIKTATPDQCTLVPDSHDQLTSDHGFNLKKDFDRLQPIVKNLKSLGVRVSVFMDPIIEQISLVKPLGADRIELYTGPYAEAYSQSEEAVKTILAQHQQAALYAQSLGLGVNAGHDLNLDNLKRYTSIPGLAEVSIGHALTVDALKIGFKEAVSAYQVICESANT